LLLLLSAGCEDGAEGHPLHDQQVRGVVADAPQLLDGHRGRQHAAGAAVLGRERDREQPGLAQQLEHVLRVLGRAVDGVGARRHTLARQPAHHLTDLALLFAEGEGRRVARAGAERRHHTAASLRHLIMRSGV
jgi:hypothetical protein